MTWEYNHYLAHHGVEGQKWGVRRYQNKDGSLTEEGKKRYLKDADEVIAESEKKLAILDDYDRMAKTGSLKSKHQEVNDVVKAYRDCGYSDAQIRAELNTTVSYIDDLREANQSVIDYERKMSDFVKSNERVTLKDIQKYNKQIVSKQGGSQSYMKGYQKERWKKATKED